MNRGRILLVALLVGGAWPAAAMADNSTFSYTGGEQTFVVPLGRTAVQIVATGAAGGGPLSGLTGGRGAVVSGLLKVMPGEVLYVEVGGTGGQLTGGFNGGGDSRAFGGGGASDVRLVSSSAGGSLASRVIVAAGGGGSASPAAAGGDAGAAGQSNGPSTGGGAGTQVAGGAGGCGPLEVGCGADGSLGSGGAGGSSGAGADGRAGGGGGGGLFGGGGGAGNVTDGVGGGGGGSSLVPAAGSMTLAPLTTAPSVAITALTAAGGTNLPLTGTSTGTITVDLSTSPLRTHSEFSGMLTQLGRFTGTFDGFFTPGGAPPDFPFMLTGTETLRASDGSELFGTLTGSGENTSGATEGTNTVTITGGTGRFTGASGNYTETESGVFASTAGSLVTFDTTTTIRGALNLGAPR